MRGSKALPSLHTTRNLSNQEQHLAYLSKTIYPIKRFAPCGRNSRL